MLAVVIFLLIASISAYAKDIMLASSYPIYYPLKYLAEGRFEVDVLIKSQADPHHYELKPDDMLRLQRAKAFFYLGVEGWEQRVAGRVQRDKAYSLRQGLQFIRAGKGLDPHIWVSPSAYYPIVKNMQQALSRIDPAGSEYYKKRAEDFLSQLKDLDEEYKKSLSTCKSKVLVTTHLSTAYLGRDYGLEVIGLRGVHAEEEPKPSEVRRLIEKLRQAKVKVVFAELGQDERLARRIAQEVGARVVPLNTSLFPEEKGDDYFSIMRRNLNRLSEGLDCQLR